MMLLHVVKRGAYTNFVIYSYLFTTSLLAGLLND